MNRHYITPTERSQDDLFKEGAPIRGNMTVSIKIEMSSGKIVREVSFTSLDFVVTIGSIIDLFFGASFLCLVEIVYIWIVRKF